MRRTALLFSVLLVLAALLGGCEYWRLFSLKEVFPPTRDLPTVPPLRMEFNDFMERC